MQGGADVGLGPPAAGRGALRGRGPAERARLARVVGPRVAVRDGILVPRVRGDSRRLREGGRDRLEGAAADALELERAKGEGADEEDVDDVDGDAVGGDAHSGLFSVLYSS